MLLYLPRLMVYHCSATPRDVQSETFKVMERRLLKAIGTPAMLVSWVVGLYLLVAGGHLTSGLFWPYMKLLLVLVMTALHMRFAWHVKRFAADQNAHSERYFRIMNELPALVMIGVVVLAVVEPI